MKKIRIVRILTSIFFVAVCLFVTFHENGKVIHVWTMAYQEIQAGRGSSKLVFSLFLLFVGICGLLRLLLIWKKRSIGILYYLPAVMYWISVPFMAIAIKNGISYLWIPISYIIIGSVEFLFVRYQENRDEMEIARREAKAKEKEEKEHRKRATYFPGKYPPELYQIMRELFVSRRKSQILMMCSEIFTAACTYIVLSMYGIMREAYSVKNILAGGGLDRLFMNFGMILAILGILMMVMMISWYIREKRQDIRPMIVMGMRRKTAYLLFLTEFGSVAVLSGILGTGVGAVAASILRGELQKAAPEGMGFPEIVTAKYILIGFGAYILLMFLALMLNQENFLSLGTSVDRNEDIQREKRAKKGLIPLFILGIVLLVLAVAWFSLREWAESLYIHILSSLGILVLLITVTGMWLCRREKRAAYYRKMMKTNLFYHRFWSNIERLFFLAIIQFLALSVFAVSEAGTWIPQNIEKMYPYDIVVTAYEADLPELEKIAEEHHADVIQYPMVRMTSIYGSDKLARWTTRRPIQWPQGQQIAISESSYGQMCRQIGKEEKDLHLTGEEMHVVYQQDLSVKAHIIDWDTYRMEKHLRFGQPLQYYNTADFRKIYPTRAIKSEERDSLIGSFHQGMQDNLIVLSDAYFQKVHDQISEYNREHWEERQQAGWYEWKTYTISHTENMTEGPTMLFCMKLDTEDVPKAAADLEYLNKKHEFDMMWDRMIQPFYVKSQMIINTESEIFFTRMIHGFILLILLVLGIFQYFVKMKTEEDTWKWENTFLKRIGMYEKERKEKICWHLCFFLFVPAVIGIVGGVVFAGLTAKARLYTAAETMQFAGCLAVIYAVWLLIWYVAYRVMKWSIWKGMEK